MVKVSTNKYLNYVSPLDAEDVVDETSFFVYAHQKLGVPYPRSKEISKVRKQLNLFFEAYPQASYNTLTDVVDWAKIRRKHFDMCGLVSAYRWAYEDGHMRKLTRPAPDADGMLNTLLDVVEDPVVRTNLRQAPDVKTRDEIYESYMASLTETEPSERSALLDSLDLFAGEVVKFKQTLAHDWQFGTVVGEEDGNVVVYDKETFSLKPWMIQSRVNGVWKGLNP